MKKQGSVNIGLIGLGTVGTGVVKILQRDADALARKTGIRLELKKICVKSLSKKRQVRVPKFFLTTKPADILNDPSIDIVVEVIGGIHPAKEIIRKALASGKHVVTANKALLAEQGAAIYAEAAKRGAEVGIEASVCGGVPVIKSIQEGLAANNITHFFGIVNGTCNYILTQMSHGDAAFHMALRDAQERGFAEADPTLDVSGADSAHKLAILARIAFREEIPYGKISVEGIEKLSPHDIEYARELGYGIKLLAIGKRQKSGLELRVHPTLLPFDHPLSSVRGVYNAVFVHAEEAGDLLFYGRGAGMMPTASAVMSDIIDIAKKIRGVSRRTAASAKPARSHILSPDEIVSRYYLRFQAADKPGVLGRIAQTLGKNGISILSVHQKEGHDKRSVPVVILTYDASEKNVRRALKAIDAMGDVREKTVVMRVES